LHAIVHVHAPFATTCLRAPRHSGVPYMVATAGHTDPRTPYATSHASLPLMRWRRWRTAARACSRITA
jgi:hypothetical protein